MTLTVSRPKPELYEVQQLVCASANLAEIVERKARQGWHIADGRYGTTDLRKKFLRMAENAGFTDIAAAAGMQSVTPVGNVSIANRAQGGDISVANRTVSGWVTVNNHVLSVNEMPVHNHATYLPSCGDQGQDSSPHWNVNTNVVFSNVGAATDSRGASWGHGHGADFGSNPHNHTATFTAHQHNHDGTFTGAQHTNEPQHVRCVYLQYTGIRIKGVTP